MNKNVMARTYFKNIIFSKTPLIKRFRYKDEFQIYPIDIEGAPKTKYIEVFPLILEYHIDMDQVEDIQLREEFQEGKEWIVSATHQTNRLREITNLLSAITNHRFFIYRAEKFWTLPFEAEEGKSLNDLSSIQAFTGYHFPEMSKKLIISSFSDKGETNITLVTPSTYYMHDPVESPLKEITFPNSIDQILDEYHNLGEKSKKIIDSAAYSICNSLDIKGKMISLSFFSAVSSIETVANYEYRKEKIEFECKGCQTIKKSSYHCEKCNRPIWGIAAKFRSFLSHYVSSAEESLKIYRKIYNVRSKITHTEYLLIGDRLIDWSNADKTEEVFLSIIEAIQLSRIGIVNWLLKSDKK